MHLVDFSVIFTEETTFSGLLLAFLFTYSKVSCSKRKEFAPQDTPPANVANPFKLESDNNEYEDNNFAGEKSIYFVK